MPAPKSLKMKLADLPAPLKKLVTDTGIRPRMVWVDMVSGPAVTGTGLMGGEVRGLGAHTVHPTEHWMGDDGESRWWTKHEWTVAAATSHGKCGRIPSRATVTLAGLPEGFEGSAEDAYAYCASLAVYGVPPPGYKAAAPAKSEVEACWDYWLATA